MSNFKKRMGYSPTKTGLRSRGQSINKSSILSTTGPISQQNDIQIQVSTFPNSINQDISQ